MGIQRRLDFQALDFLHSSHIADPWQALGVTRGVDEVAIRTACRQLSLKVHPDKNPTERERATLAFQKLQDFQEQIKEALAQPWSGYVAGSTASRDQPSAEACDSQWQSAWHYASQAWTPDYATA